ncbi:major facilitator superfamily MFS-1 [Fomitiporia mediterranea MF3/22]|uniref:major facilitator superfamily MFS-1 n=1 Tax=Fomitiporia mediterranea (strain MF3/22) TaxID=694068 RepID=UPI0004409C5E|nr:major facilitator superfamily MFS-1 [Fomitiporia mediterranea MF3/22]EJD01298.1 major facilitator superfamily MFS-1 [Fomitiporia mediterranea MF3/22]
MSSPLPALPMAVLSIVMLGEFLTANVATPFLLFMVEGFGVFKEEADVGYWTGILVSCFFITQFLTSLLWATAAEKHGTRAVLFVSLLGSSLTCFAFGTSTSLPQAMTIRLLQGVFAGAIGVGRGNIATITDPSNEGRAYAILGFAWGFGGVAGAIVGGSFENPAKKWPGMFADVPLFVKYPYLLPTAIAASITFIGAILSLFLAPDGGPREGAIRLPPEKVTAHETIPEEPSTPVEESAGAAKSLKQRLSNKLSGYFAKRVRDAHEVSSLTEDNNNTPVPLSPSFRRGSNNRFRTQSRTSRTDGSAYGYGAGYRNRLASNVSQSLAGRRGSLASTIARRRQSNAIAGGASGNEQVQEGGELNFAQRLLMANELAVTNIADLWVAAAINADNEDVFLSDSEVNDEDDDPFQDDDDDEEAQPPTLAARSSLNVPAPRTLGPSSPGRTGRMSTIHRPSDASVLRLGSPRRPSHRQSVGQVIGASAGSPRKVSGSVPAIFSHTGVRTPSMLEHQAPPPQPLLPRESGDVEAGLGDSLVPILEGERQTTFARPDQPTTDEPLNVITEKQPSILSQLPAMIIFQYGLLALHSTTHDQVFLSYLVSKYPAGGLNLNAGHFAQLIALMSLASIAYQFYLYPNMGPPRGRFSHLAMFRIGSLLYIPAYLTVILYRPLASAEDDGNFFLMAALVFSTALRYAGITFTYTAVAILLNYMSPPHILGYANGVAQSIVSFARFLGPVLGGYLWSVSVDGNPSGYPFGFIVCAGVTAVAIALSFFIR